MSARIGISVLTAAENTYDQSFDNDPARPVLVWWFRSFVGLL
jgi:hypothetical protein